MTSSLVVCRQLQCRSQASSLPWGELVACVLSPPGGRSGRYGTAALWPSSWRLPPHSGSPTHRWRSLDKTLKTTTKLFITVSRVCTLITFAEVSRAASRPLSFASLQASSNRTWRSFSRSHLLPEPTEMVNVYMFLINAHIGKFAIYVEKVRVKFNCITWKTQYYAVCAPNY